MKKSRISVFIVVMVMLIAMLSACNVDISFKINFEVDGVQYKTIDTGGMEKISLPTDPTKEGYTFDGWYFDKDIWEQPLTINSFLDAKLTSSMTVYAKWLLNEAQTTTYTVTFNSNGGSAVEAQKVADGSFANQPTAPTKVGYSFDGWCKEVGCITAFNFATEKITADTTIYAKWKINSYTVTFATNGGSTVASQIIDYNGFANQPTVPTKTGFTFAGWYKEANFAMQFNFASDIITANTTIYAKWLDIFDVTFEVNGGSAVTAQKVTDSSLAGQPTDPIKTGFAFAGWYKEANFATPFNFSADKITANTTIYAKWLDIFDVTFEVNGGSAVTAQKVTDSSLAGQPTDPIKTGFAFEGWYKEANFATPFNFTTEKITADTTIYAKWKINSYTVTFETNGGSTVASQTIDYNSFATVPTSPTKVGYSFDGWCKDESLTTPFAFTTEKITADTKIYAKWKINSYTVTFATNGGSTVASQTIDYNSLANQPTVPTKTGFTFAG